jgi:probable DNA repair protein
MLDKIIITPNNRLQKVLSEDLARKAMNEQSSYVVEAPPVNTLAEFIEMLWENAQYAGYKPALSKSLITQERAFVLWASIIQNDDSLSTIMQPTELAQLAAKSFRHLLLWQIDPLSLSPDSEESTHFKRWANAYTLQTKSNVNEEQALAIIIDAISDGVIELPQKVILWAFDEHPPLYARLFEAMKNVSTVEEQHGSNFDAVVNKTSCFDNQEQVKKVAAWAYNTLEREPTAKIAIVVPDLLQRKRAILNALNETFEPQVILPSTPDYVPPYNVSAGDPLSSQPIIHIAQTLLNIGLNTTDIKSLRSVLLSPFIANAEKESGKRSLFDLTLMEASNELSLLQLLSLERCPPLFAKQITQFSSVLALSPDKDTVANWLKRFEAALLDIGWPGDRSTNSKEYQALKQHTEMLHRACNHYSSDLVSMSQALFYYNLAVNNTIYAPESKGSPIQVLGMMEAAGLTFDYMYILDMNDNVWPPAAAPNPLLPELLQIENKMPHCDAQRELEFSANLIERFKTSCKQLTFSYCKMDRERELTPSFFVAGESIPDSDFSINSLNHVDLLYKQIPVNIIEDKQIPFPHKEASGGVSLLKDIANCPFSAFIKHRLKVRDMPVSTMGFNPSQRGELLHLALDNLWRDLKSQEALLALSDEAVNARIEVAIQAAIDEFTIQDDVEPVLLGLERSHLLKTINKWLNIEKERPPFIVESTEKREKLSIGPIILSIRLDRVDSIIDTGNKAVIDYKSGSASCSELFKEDTFKDAQLPLCALTQENVEMVAYGSLKRGYETMNGIADNDSITTTKNRHIKIREAKKSLAAMIESWKSRLVNLANDYIEGNIDITPSATSCTYCPGQLICRVSNN